MLCQAFIYVPYSDPSTGQKRASREPTTHEILPIVTRKFVPLSSSSDYHNTLDLSYDYFFMSYLGWIFYVIVDWALQGHIVPL